jgi:hypothetical protein
MAHACSPAQPPTAASNGNHSGTIACNPAPVFNVTWPSFSDATILTLGTISAAETLTGFGNVVTGANGTVSVTGTASDSSVSLGNGADSVCLSGVLNTIVLGNGNVDVQATGGGATVSIGSTIVSVNAGAALQATFALSASGLCGSGFVNSGGSFGWFDSGSGNIGILSGWDNAAASDGADNIGALDGNGNGGTDNGSGNIGTLSGNLDGQDNSGLGTGIANGSANVGLGNGNVDGSGNNGPDNGTNNGDNNLGTANGNFDGNLNTGTDNGNSNGNGNIGDLNGSSNGNGAPLVFGSAASLWPVATLTGALDTVVVGNGNDVIAATGGLSTIVAGNGNDQITIGGSYDTVVAGNGQDTVTGTVDHAAISLGNGADNVCLTGAGSDVIFTGSGSDVIRLSGWGNLVDCGASQHTDFIYGGCGDDTFVIAAPGSGLDQISNFSLCNGDVLDLGGALAAAGWHGAACNIANEVHVTTSGANSWLAIGPGAGTMVAELVGVRTTLSALLAHGALDLS